MTTYSIIVGFTGTRNGMTDKQKTSFRTLMNMYRGLNTNINFIHGDCIGADADAHTLCRNVGIRKIGSYPCNLKNQRAYTDADQIADPAPPLERNRVIADRCDILIACPSTDHEIQRSGTWATIRHRSRSFQNFQLVIIWPDGSIDENY